MTHDLISIGGDGDQWVKIFPIASSIIFTNKDVKGAPSVNRANS